MPFGWIVYSLDGALSTMVISPVRVPIVVGVKVTVIRQLDPAGTLAGNCWSEQNPRSPSLIGAPIPGDWDRRLTYAAVGLTNALAALVLLVSNQPSVYLAGTAFYLITEGLGWARSTPLMVEIVGVEARDASTLYSVLNAIVTIPLLYMIRLDGFGFSKFGTHGLLWTDAR